MASTRMAPKVAALMIILSAVWLGAIIMGSIPRSQVPASIIPSSSAVGLDAFATFTTF